MKINAEKHAIVAAYLGMGKQAVFGKGGFWVRGDGFRTLAQARKETGVNMKKTVGPRPSRISFFAP